jgi:hypothetical protein
VTRYASANALRTRVRRDKHERQAAMLHAETLPDDAGNQWNDIAPQLDEAVHRLRAQDRDALLLRFYQRLSMAEVGEAMGVSEDAAKKRVATAVAKLKSHFGVGTVGSVDGLGALLLAHATHAAPAGLASLCVPGASSAAALTLAKGISHMWFVAKVKMAALAFVVLAALPVGIHALVAMQATTPIAPVASPIASSPLPPVTVADATPAPAAVAVAEPVPELDPVIRPYVDSHTFAVITGDISAVDLDALAEQLQQAVVQTQKNPAQAQQMSGAITAVVSQGTMWQTGFTAAGGSKTFIVVASGAGPSEINALWITPTDNAAKAPLLAKMMGPPMSSAVDANGNVRQPNRWVSSVRGNVIIAGQYSYLLKLPAAPTGQPRPDLAQALSAASSGTISMGFVPKSFTQLLTLAKRSKKAPGGKETNALLQLESDHVKWIGTAITLPPADSSNVTSIVQCDDQATTKKFSADAGSRASLAAMMPGMDFKPLYTATKVMVIGTTVTTSVQIQPVMNLLVNFIGQQMSARASGQPASQPH